MKPASCGGLLELGGVHVLHPGDVVCGDSGERLETLLGSCVAIILTDPRRTVAAICHVVHAGAATQAQPGNCAYGEEALAAMHARLRARGINPLMCEAYVYGGGNMFPHLFGSSHPGDANARWALAALARDGNRVLFHDLGGATYRRLAWTVGHELPAVIAMPV
jgi:chemotaxis protein CheD